MSNKTNTITETGEIVYRSFRSADSQGNLYGTLKIPVIYLSVKEDIYKCDSHTERDGNKEMIASKGDTLVVIDAPVNLEGEEESKEGKKGVFQYIFKVESKDQTNKRHDVVWRRPKIEIDEHCEPHSKGNGVLELQGEEGEFGSKKSSKKCFSIFFGRKYNSTDQVRVLISADYYNIHTMYTLLEREDYNAVYLPNEGILRFWNKSTGTYTDHGARSVCGGGLSWDKCSNSECELCYPRGAQVEEPRPESLVQTEIERKEEGPEVLVQAEVKEDEIGETVEQ